MQAAERVGHATPVGLGLTRSAIHVCHYHKTVREQPAVCRRDRQRHGQTFTTKALEEPGLPSQIGVAPRTKSTNRELSVDAHTPHIVRNSTFEWFNASYASTPLLKCLPPY